MKSTVKKMAVTVLALMMVLSATACGGKTDSSAPAADTTSSSEAASSDAASSDAASSDAASSEAAAPADGAAMSEADYLKKVQDIANQITEASSEMATVDATDTQAVIDATKKMVETVKPLYTELGGLQAPEKFADAQAKIKAGTDASLDLLDLSLEMLALQEDGATAADAQDKLKELQTKTADLQTKAADMQAGLTEVLTAAAAQ